jgi:hypothetical protein
MKVKDRGQVRTLEVKKNSDCPLERLTISLKGQQGLGCSVCKVSYRANRTMKANQ